MDETIELYSDGGSRGNPGKAACAFVLYKGGMMLHGDSKFLGIATNNSAEYQGVIFALSWLLKQKLEYTGVLFYLDSELVVKQLNGQYKVKSIDLKRFYEECLTLKRKINKPVRFVHIPRNQNKEADKLLNICLDKHS